jgi:hypothetical protein
MVAVLPTLQRGHYYRGVIDTAAESVAAPF